MRKVLLLLGLVLALVVPATALAATLDINKFNDLRAFGNACDKTKIPDTDPATGNYAGAWYHFVLNQVSTDYLAGVKIRTTFTAAQFPGNDVSPTAVLKSVQHFYVFSAGELTAAITVGVNPGSDAKLVLSSAECAKKAPS
jgi:hypothetical protein